MENSLMSNNRLVQEIMSHTGFLSALSVAQRSGTKMDVGAFYSNRPILVRLEEKHIGTLKMCIYVGHIRLSPN